ncbi:hypothetical protein [Glycomyces sp. NPDC021274]|jgi:hypothetical protein|uniref:hypothetical protein n=1 Tax=Glycomyces sp. NPDC021274 TaxID=3155120 RepID=UPI0033ED0999
MTDDPRGEAYSPGERIILAAEAVLLRAELADHRDERQANFDRLAKMWQPTMDEVVNANELQSIAINSYTTARIENAEDLAILNRAIALVDQAVALLERPTNRLTPHLPLTLEQLQAAIIDPETYEELLPPLDALGLLIAEAAATEE